MWQALVILVVFTTSTAGFHEKIQGSAKQISKTNDPESGKDTEAFSEDSIKKLLKKIDKEYSAWMNKGELARWNYQTNLTDGNLAKKIEVTSQVANYRKKLWTEVKAIPWKELQDEDAKRQFYKYSTIGAAALPEKLFKEYENITSQMSKIYSTAKICRYKNPKKCDLPLEPKLVKLMASSRDPKHLEHNWLEWREKVAKKIKPFFPRYVELGNIAAQLDNFTDKSAFWLKEYEATDFQEQIETLWQDIRPLYLQLHAYVRAQLRKKYGAIVSKDGPIPAHLVGEMNAQNWEAIANFTLPFPKKGLPDPTPAIVKKGLNPQKMFKLTESCFVSMNMSAMPELFWKNSILEKPKNREIVCQANSWDFYDGKDFRIKECTNIDAHSFTIAHHEMSHIQYFMGYKDQPAIYKDGPNPGFHEAIADLIYLSVSTPAHLQKIKLLENYTKDDETSLNHLYLKGLVKIAQLPFAYIIDLWRWEIFRGKIKPDQYNCYWWKLAEKYQGIEPPVSRTEEDFDPAGKYHVISDVEFLRYYVSFVVQFQFYRSLCIVAKEYDPEDPETKPLHECDITESKEAGNLMISMFKMGASKPWQDAMEVLTGQRKMSSSGLLDYFKPLLNWLTAENKKMNEYIGWKNTKKRTYIKVFVESSL